MSILRGDVMRRAVNVCLIKGFCLWILLIKCHSTPKLTPSRNSICWSQRSNCTPSTTHTNRLQLLKVIGNFIADKDGSSLNTKHSLRNTFQIFPSHPKNSREMNPLVTNNCLLRPTRIPLQLDSEINPSIFLCQPESLLLQYTLQLGNKVW